MTAEHVMNSSQTLGTNGDFMLGRRLRRRPNIKSTLYTLT